MNGMMNQPEQTKQGVERKVVSLPIIDQIVVLLPSHVDPELGKPTKHYHCDPRFTGSEMKLIRDDGQKVEWVTVPEPEWVELEVGISVYLQLLRYYEGMVIRDGKCPHKAIVIQNGQCPAHGLRFDADGKVLGTLKDCYLMAGKSIGERGDFQSILHTFSDCFQHVHLMYRGIRLATSELGIGFTVRAKDRSKFTFTLGGSYGREIRPPVSGA